LTKGALRKTRKMTSLRIMAPCRRLAAHARMSNPDQLSAT
jgi:hypothetical protein